MKRGWIVYNQAGAEKNEWFIQRLTQELATYSLSLTLRVFSKKEEFFKGELPDFAIIRSILPQVNRTLESHGVRVFNNAKTARIACDKWETYCACRAWGIPTLPTVLYGQEIKYPCVMKTRNGHGGEEVFWVNSRAQAEEIRLANNTKNKYILQQPNDVLGKDMRVYAIGGKIVASVLRESDGDFRSNFSLGGSVEKAQADEWQNAVVKKLYEKLGFDYVGIDFLPTKDGWVLNEIEDSAGARMLYSCSDFDIIQAYAQHIARALREET